MAGRRTPAGTRAEARRLNLSAPLRAAQRLLRGKTTTLSLGQRLSCCLRMAISAYRRGGAGRGCKMLCAFTSRVPLRFYFIFPWFLLLPILPRPLPLFTFLPASLPPSFLPSLPRSLPVSLPHSVPPSQKWLGARLALRFAVRPRGRGSAVRMNAQMTRSVISERV